MRKSMTSVAAAVLAAACLAALVTGIVAAGAGTSRPGQAAATTTTTTLAPPVQGTGKHNLFFYVDTVQGAGGSPAPAAGCSMSNLFEPGQVVVFRMFGIHTPTGGTDLTPATVATAYVTVPGEPKLPLVYGTHGTSSYWTAAWTVGQSYPLGTVNFTVTVTTKAVPKSGSSPAVPAQTGVFSQKGLAPPSVLQVVAP